ncbi:MAG: alpha/beta fold hydrolase [Aggregatilineales bacterium]
MNKEILNYELPTFGNLGAGNPTASGSLANFVLNRRMIALRSVIHALCRINPRLATELLLFLFLRPRRKPITYTRKLPAGARPITIYHNLCKLKGYEWGDGSKTILLVHGWESHLGHMLPVVKPLLDAGFKVMAFDAPGHGQSPQLYSNMVDFGDAVRDAVEQYAPIHAIIGNSFGGAATALSLKRNKSISVDRLILVSPMQHILQHIDIFDCLMDVPDEVMSRVLWKIAGRIGMPLGQCDVLEAVSDLSMPGLLIHDVEDEVIPVQSSRMIADVWQNSFYVETTGLGHRGAIRDKCVIDEIIHFLKSVPA